MPLANPAPNGSIGASLVATAFPLCLRAMGDTNSCALDMVGAPWVAASFHFRAMGDTNSTLNGSIRASLVAAVFHLLLRAMRDANSALNGSIGATVVAAACFAHGCQLIRGG